MNIDHREVIICRMGDYKNKTLTPDSEWAILARKTRIDLRLDLRAFASLLANNMSTGCSKATVNNWELGKYPPKLAEMDYLFHHARDESVREFARAMIQVLSPALHADHG